MSLPIYILGNVDVDVSMGPLESLPAWGTEVVAQAPTTYRPGGAAGNMALALAGLVRPSGSLLLTELEKAVSSSVSLPAGPMLSRPQHDPPAVCLFCAVGDDAQGRSLHAQFSRAGLGGWLEPIPGELTSLGLALVRADGERAFVTDLGALRHMDLVWARKALAGVEGPGFFVVNGASLLPGLPPADVGALFQEMRGRGLKTCLDTGWDVNGWPPATVQQWRDVMALTDFFFPNEMEAAVLSGETDPARAADALRAFGAGTVAVKVGPKGVVLADMSGVRLIPTEPKPIPDTTGAGDIFDAGFLYALGFGWPADDAARLGQRLAAVILLSRRTRFPSLSQMLAAVS